MPKTVQYLDVFTLRLRELINYDHRNPGEGRLHYLGDYFHNSEFQSLHNAFPLPSTKKQTVELLHKKLLNHKWGDVVIILVGILQLNWKAQFTHLREFNKSYEEIVWRVGMAAILHHPLRINSDTCKHVVTHRRVLKTYSEGLDHVQILLEHAFLLLSMKNLPAAKEELSCYHIVEKSIRAKESRIENIEYWRVTIEGYLGLLEYILWQSLLLNTEKEEIPNESTMIELQTIADKALEHFEILSTTPGVWDIFVRKHIKILLKYGKVEDALKSLTFYSNNNIGNPNAHKYLANFLDINCNENEMDTGMLRETTLERLFRVSPTDPMCLELYKIYFKRFQEDILQRSTFNLNDLSSMSNPLIVLLTMLDYPSCANDIKIWNELIGFISFMHQTLGTKKTNKIFIKIMKKTERDQWWPSFHFSNLNNTVCDELCMAKNRFRSFITAKQFFL